jgi:hypothetical protein
LSLASQLFNSPTKGCGDSKLVELVDIIDEMSDKQLSSITGFLKSYIELKELDADIDRIEIFGRTIEKGEGILLFKDRDGNVTQQQVNMSWFYLTGIINNRPNSDISLYKFETLIKMLGKDEMKYLKALLTLYILVYNKGYGLIASSKFLIPDNEEEQIGIMESTGSIPSKLTRNNGSMDDLDKLTSFYRSVAGEEM